MTPDELRQAGVRVKPDLAGLKALADSATPGPLEARYAPGIPTDCVDFGVISHATGKEVMRVWAREDAELYAALSPDVAKALIETVEAARGVVASWDDHTFEREHYVPKTMNSELSGYWSPQSAMVDSEKIAALRTALAALEAS